VESARTKNTHELLRSMYKFYRVGQQSSPLKLLAIFSLRLSIFPWNFASCCYCISIRNCQFWLIYLDI